jgi:hypothetical protein
MLLAIPQVCFQGYNLKKKKPTPPLKMGREVCQQIRGVFR